MFKYTLQTKNLVIFSLFMTLLLAMSNSDVINIEKSNTGHQGGIQKIKEKVLVDKSIYTRHFIDMFGEQTFNNFIKSNQYHSGMVGQLDDLRKFNLAEIRRLSKRYYPQLFSQQTLSQLDTTLPSGLLPNNLFSTITKIYDQQTTQLQKIILSNNHQNELDKQLQKITQIKRLLQFISRQLTAQNDLRQIIYRLKEQQTTKWVNDIVRKAIGDDATIMELISDQFIAQYGYSDEQKKEQTKYFDLQGNQVHNIN